jgi:hypothetical protein
MSAVRELRIQTSHGTVAVPDSWLAFVLRELRDPDSFVIVDHGRKNRYVQARNHEGVVLLEYRDGSPQRHYQVVGPSRADVARAFAQWADHDHSFVQAHEWQRLADWDAPEG